VLGGVPPYTFAEVNANLGEGGNVCADFDNEPVATTGEIIGNNVNQPGDGVTEDCNFTIMVTDSATVPQVITGDFRVVIVDEP